MNLFNIRFNPDLNYIKTAESKIINELNNKLSKISVFIEDKILSTFLKLILATKRTNFFKES